MTELKLSPIEDIIEDARKGKMFILVDDESRENEGDLIIPAEKADANAINFMAKHGRGLICLALTAERVRELDLPLMPSRHDMADRTAFTVSIEARHGVSTGISASDRAKTIADAIDKKKGASDIITPGHVFPLISRDGGVLVRAGHTEAAVDVARISGHTAAGVVCEVMNDDGTMARLSDLVEFASKHKLKIAKIADLISYRLKHDSIVRKEKTMDINSNYGGQFKLHTYIDGINNVEHFALVKGDINVKEPIHVRVHVLNVAVDVLGSNEESGSKLHKSMELISQKKRGVVVLVRDTDATVILQQEIQGEKNLRNGNIGDLRVYGIGAQILADLKVSEMILISNIEWANIVGLEGYSLKVVDQIPIQADS